MAHTEYSGLPSNSALFYKDMECMASELFSSPMSDDTCTEIVGYNRGKKLSNLWDARMTNSVQPHELLDFRGFETPKLHLNKNSKHRIINKKGIQKFVERQRRKDMKTLYALLRSLQPAEYVLERLSIADQLSETANYIKDLQQKVKGLTQQRDQIKKVNLCQDLQLSTPSNSFPACEIRPVGSGVLVSTSTLKNEMNISDLLRTLENDGLDIVHADSYAINEALFHTVHAKVSDPQDFNCGTLYDKVWNLIARSADSKRKFGEHMV